MKKPPSPISLTVHRNTVERRRKRIVADEMAYLARKMTMDTDIRAYAIVGIAADGGVCSFWDTGGVLPMWAFPATVAEALTRNMRNSGVDDDWRPSLPVVGSGSKPR